MDKPRFKINMFSQKTLYCLSVNDLIYYKMASWFSILSIIAEKIPPK